MSCPQNPAFLLQLVAYAFLLTLLVLYGPWHLQEANKARMCLKDAEQAAAAATSGLEKGQADRHALQSQNQELAVQVNYCNLPPLCAWGALPS